MRPKNYLNNKDLLAEIHKSKLTFCSFISDEDRDFDIILDSISDINDDTIEEAKRNRARRIAQRKFDEAKLQLKNTKLADHEIDPSSIEKTDLVFRIMTFDHIPDDPARKKNPKSVADRKIKLNFPPFHHYRYVDDHLKCVAKSHWVGGIQNGYFSKDQGQATNKLARMWMKICDRYATRGNVRGYTYNDEMRGQAILQLTQIGLQFDESKSNNPFAYYTAAVTNSFVRVINIEKRNQNIRDDILEANGMSPSYTRQHQGEWDHALERVEEDKRNKS